jgi:HD-like signal output (HDOD) protein
MKIEPAAGNRSTSTDPGTAGPDPFATAEHWLKDSASLVSPPDICIKIFELMETNQASAQTLGSVISRDPSLSARLLRIVNSAFYGFPHRIDTISRAVTVIGISELYNLVVTVSAITSFSRIPNFIVNIDTFWRHSVSCGILARELARQCRVLHPERLFVAGIMHDIGSLVIYHRAPDRIKKLLLAAQGNESILRHLEGKEFGFNHADIGGMLLSRWQLPKLLQEAVQWHHDPDSAPEARLEAAIVHIADALANHSEQGAFYALPSPDLFIEDEALKITGLDPDPARLSDIIEDTREQYHDAVNLFSA